MLPALLRWFVMMPVLLRLHPVRLASCLLYVAVVVYVAPPAGSSGIMPHLLFPNRSTYPPTYNLSRATAIQTCQKPGNSLDYIRDYGIVSCAFPHHTHVPCSWYLWCQLCRAAACARISV